MKQKLASWIWCMYCEVLVQTYWETKVETGLYISIEVAETGSSCNKKGGKWGISIHEQWVDNNLISISNIPECLPD